MMTISKRDHDDFKFKPFLNIVNVTIDYCGYLQKKGAGAFLLDIFMKDLTAHSNIIQPCPVRGHLYLKNFKVDLSHIPFFISTGEYMMFLYVYFKVNGTDIFAMNNLSFAEVTN